MYIWERTRGLVVRNSNIKNIELKGGGLDDIANHGVYRIYNNTVKSGNVNNNLSKKLKVTKNIKGLVSNSTLYGIVNGGEYTNCTIKVSSQFLDRRKSFVILGIELGIEKSIRYQDQNQYSLASEYPKKE